MPCFIFCLWAEAAEAVMAQSRSCELLNATVCSCPGRESGARDNAGDTSHNDILHSTFDQVTLIDGQVVQVAAQCSPSVHKEPQREPFVPKAWYVKVCKTVKHTIVLYCRFYTRLRWGWWKLFLSLFGFSYQACKLGVTAMCISEEWMRCHILMPRLEDCLNPSGHACAFFATRFNPKTQEASSCQ